jgi:hypothetical protein
MSSYNTPILHNGVLNSVVNASDLTTTNINSTLNVSTADARYLKLSGGTETGNVTFNQSVTVPSITLSSGIITQTSSQIGYNKTVGLAITGGSVQNGSSSSPSYNTISLNAGVWIVTYYHNINCSASVTFSQIVHGLTLSSAGNYTNQATTCSSTVSEVLASGNKYITQTYVVRHSATTSYYAPILISYTTAGVVTINFGFSATRIA